MDTKQDVGGAPSQTSFHLSPYFRGPRRPSIILERGAHKPSPVGYLAPFHQDPAQRIVTLAMPYSFGYLIFPAEALLKLAEGREGCEIEWDEWKKHVAIPSIHQPDFVNVWVSGCRLFSIASPGYGLDAHMEVYDFSVRGRAEYLHEQPNPDLGGVRYLAPTGVVAQLPWDIDELLDMNGSHGNVVFLRVSSLSFPSSPRD